MLRILAAIALVALVAVAGFQLAQQSGMIYDPDADYRSCVSAGEASCDHLLGE